MSWIKRKDSWLITVNEESRSSLDPIDTATGVWTRRDLEETVGSTFEVVPLKGKWAGEVLIRGLHLDAPYNEFADNLVNESLGYRLDLKGHVLMTKKTLLAPELSDG